LWIVENNAWPRSNQSWPSFENISFAQSSATTSTGVVQGFDGKILFHGQSYDGREILSQVVDNTNMYVLG
jgi:hypothetical protein